MKVLEALAEQITQAEFAQMVGVSEAAVSQAKSSGVLEAGDTAHGWLLAYTLRLREQAAGRVGAEGGGLDLVQERAALARAQREAQQMKNAVTRGEYAPIGLLADVLAAASAAVADRFDQIEGALRKAAPDMDDDTRAVVMRVVASARNEWVRATAALVDAGQIDRFESETSARYRAATGLEGIAIRTRPAAGTSIEEIPLVNW